MRVTDAIILALILAVVLFLRLRGRIPKFWLRKRAGVSRRGGNIQVQELLIKKGFQILRIQERVDYQSSISGKQNRGHLLADFIVEKDGKILAVKIGSSADDVSHMLKAEGRLHLLQMQLLFGAAGVLIVDPENDKIYTAFFKIRNMVRKTIYLYVFLAGATAGAAVVLLLFLGGGLLP